MSFLFIEQLDQFVSQLDERKAMTDMTRPRLWRGPSGCRDPSATPFRFGVRSCGRFRLSGSTPASGRTGGAASDRRSAHLIHRADGAEAFFGSRKGVAPAS